MENKLLPNMKFIFKNNRSANLKKKTSIDSMGDLLEGGGLNRENMELKITGMVSTDLKCLVL